MPEKDVVKLVWIRVFERAADQHWGGCPYEVYEGAEYESYDRGGVAFKTLADVGTFLQEQGELHSKVAAEYQQARQQVAAEAGRILKER